MSSSRKLVLTNYCQKKDSQNTSQVELAKQLPDDVMEVLVKNHRSKEAAIKAYKDNFREIIKKKRQQNAAAAE